MKGSIRFNDAVNAEVTTDGTDITKVVNVATGEEYGGGGGGTQTANVKFSYFSSELRLYFIYPSPEALDMFDINDTTTFYETVDETGFGDWYNSVSAPGAEGATKTILVAPSGTVLGIACEHALDILLHGNVQSLGVLHDDEYLYYFLVTGDCELEND